MFKDPIRTSKRTPHFTFTKINWLTLFKDIITIYNKKNTKSINKKCRLTAKDAGTYIYHSALKG
jgi:hypothetical protein